MKKKIRNLIVINSIFMTNNIKHVNIEGSFQINFHFSEKLLTKSNSGVETELSVSLKVKQFLKENQS